MTLYDVDKSRKPRETWRGSARMSRRWDREDAFLVSSKRRRPSLASSSVVEIERREERSAEQVLSAFSWQRRWYSPKEPVPLPFLPIAAYSRKNKRKEKKGEKLRGEERVVICSGERAKGKKLEPPDSIFLTHKKTEKIGFFRLFSCLQQLCCCSAKVSPSEEEPSGGVPPLAALPAPRRRELIKATAEWEQPPTDSSQELSCALPPPGAGVASVLAHVAALEAAAPRATVSMYKTAMESLKRFYDALDAAAAAASSSRFSASSSSSASSSAAALAAVADVLAVVETQELERGSISAFKSFGTMTTSTPKMFFAAAEREKATAKAAAKAYGAAEEASAVEAAAKAPKEKKKPKRVRDGRDDSDIWRLQGLKRGGTKRPREREVEREREERREKEKEKEREERREKEKEKERERKGTHFFESILLNNFFLIAPALVFGEF